MTAPALLIIEDASRDVRVTAEEAMADHGANPEQVALALGGEMVNLGGEGAGAVYLYLSWTATPANGRRRCGFCRKVAHNRRTCEALRIDRAVRPGSMGGSWGP